MIRPLQKLRSSLPTTLIAATVGLIVSQCTLANEETSVQKAAVKATETTVRLFASGEYSSGVVISNAGDILSANHGLPRHTTSVTVTDSAQQTFQAQIVHRDSDRDLALLKIKGKKYPEHYALVNFSAPGIQQPVIAAGYPAHEPHSLSALVRIGEVEQSNSRVLRTTCRLTAGDSGGGLFDLNGRLVGINQKIGMAQSANVHARIEKFFRRHDLKQPVSPIPPVGALNRPTARGQENWQLRALRIFDTSTKSSDSPLSQPLSYGLIWDKQWALVKLSQIGTRKEVAIQRSMTATRAIAQVILRDLSTDLAVIALPQKTPAIQPPKHTMAKRYQLVVTKDAVPQSAIIGRVNTTVESTKAILGCTLSESNGEIRIDAVSPNSAAALGNLHAGDFVTSIDEEPVHGLDEIGDQLQRLQPGDWSIFTVKRGTLALNCHVQLQHDPAAMLERSRYLDGASGSISIRRSGFQNVIQHDAELTPLEMGSPLISQDGQLLGINIAVRSREAIIAIPAQALEQLVKQASKALER